MVKSKLPVPVHPVPLLHSPPDGGNLVAFIIGVETYQSKAKGQIPNVDFAKDDARAVAETLVSIYGADRSDVQLLVDDQATFGNIGYQLKQTIAGLGCEPGQKSYPSNQLKHGIWTHFLLTALRGEDELALAVGRNLTDVSLRDYLRKVVPRFLTQSTTHKGNQVPMALVSASNTFLIRHIPEPPVAVGPEGDLTHVGLVVTQEYFERTQRGDIKALAGWKKGTHFIADRVTAQTNFVVGLLAPQIDQEVQQLYDEAKAIFRFRRKDVLQESGDGQGRLDTSLFRYWIESRQRAQDPSEYSIARRLELREGAERHLDQLDELFGSDFERIVVKTERLDRTFDEVVELFEDIEQSHGGELREDQANQVVTYTFEGGPTVRVDLAKHRFTVSAPGARAPSSLLQEARKIRIGSSNPTQRLVR